MKKRNLGRVSEPFPIASATLLIGQNKGKEPVNRRGTFCDSRPTKFSRKDVDETVRALRVGSIVERAETEAAARAARAKAEKSFAASRTNQRGWYKGAPEDSVAFTFHHDPDVPGEGTPEAFRFRMKQLAEKLTGALCQDSVILTFDTPGERGTHFVDTNSPEDAAVRRDAQAAVRSKVRR